METTICDFGYEGRRAARKLHPKHGLDGWELVKYDWIEKTGDYTATYERTVKGSQRGSAHVETFKAVGIHPRYKNENAPL